MKDTNYYKQLSLKYFEATATPFEERRLKAFLAHTQDPAFDEVKAVAGFFAAGRKARRVRRINWIPAVAAALVAVALPAGIVIGTERHQARQLASMERTLTEIFSSGADVENTLTRLFDREQ